MLGATEEARRRSGNYVAQANKEATTQLGFYFENGAEAAAGSCLRHSAPNLRFGATQDERSMIL